MTNSVLYFHRTKGEGVEGVHIWSIIQSLRDMGYHVDVISPDGKQCQNNDNESNVKANVKGKSFSKKLYSVISKYMPEIIFEVAEIMYNIRNYYIANKLLKEKKYKFIYERYAIFSFIPALLAKKYDIPLVMEINYTSQSPLYRKRSKIMKPLAVFTDKYVFRKTMVFSAVSSKLQEDLKLQYSVPDNKIIMTPNAADPEKFNMNRNALGKIGRINLKDKHVIGFVGGFYPWHGVQFLIDAYSEVIKQYPNVVLLLIGDGPERGAIENYIENNKLSDSIILLGRIAHEKLPDYIATFDAGIMPDSNDYGSPMKIFEYMAQGCPVIAPDYGPILDVVQDGVHGFVFKKKDKMSLVEALVNITRGQVDLEGIRRNCRTLIEEDRNWGNNARMVVQAVENIN